MEKSNDAAKILHQSMNNRKRCYVAIILAKNFQIPGKIAPHKLLRYQNLPAASSFMRFI